MRYHFFLHYGWFFQNLGKEGQRTFMHTTVKKQASEFVIPTFHDYSLEPKITKCGDPLYNLEYIYEKWADSLRLQSFRTHFLFLAPEKMCTYIYPKLEKSHESTKKKFINSSIEISVQEKKIL